MSAALGAAKSRSPGCHGRRKASGRGPVGAGIPTLAPTFGPTLPKRRVRRPWVSRVTGCCRGQQGGPSVGFGAGPVFSLGPWAAGVDGLCVVGR